MNLEEDFNLVELENSKELDEYLYSENPFVGIEFDDSLKVSFWKINGDLCKKNYLKFLFKGLRQNSRNIRLFLEIQRSPLEN